MRFLLGIAGLIALGAATLMSVVNAGGLYAPMAPGIIAMAVILAVGSAAVSYAYGQRHAVIAVVLGCCVLLSESGAGLMTARRVMENREALRAPIAELATKRKAALAELAAIETEKPAAADSSRLTVAEAAKAAAEAAVRDKAADKGCRENCRLLLQSAVDAAQREVSAARADFEDLERQGSKKHEDRLTAARAAVAALPAARSATPLSDETGVPEWAFDIWEALALSIGLNIPGSLLIALAVGVYPKSPEEASKPDTRVSATGGRAHTTTIESRPIGKVSTFMLERLEPSGRGRVEVADVYAAYGSWCSDSSKDALSAAAFGDDLQAVIEGAEIEFVKSRGRVFLVGLKLVETGLSPALVCATSSDRAA